MCRAQVFKRAWSVKVVSAVEKPSLDIVVGSKPGRGSRFEIIFT